MMIFVCTGTQIYQFDRLIKKIDELVEDGTINDKIFAQIGAGNYLPKNFEYKKFINKDEFTKYQEEADVIISHGGTGALIGASKLGKNIIAVPRLSKYHEHIDDHQLQIVGVLEKEGYVRAVYDIDRLGETIKLCETSPIKKIYDKPSNIVSIIDAFIQDNY